MVTSAAQASKTRDRLWSSSAVFHISSVAIVCLRPVCGCVLAWRVGMILCHTARSWYAAYIVPLFLAWLCLPQWPADFSWSRSDISIAETWCLVTGMVNWDREFVWAKSMLVGNVILLERVHCPHPHYISKHSILFGSHHDEERSIPKPRSLTVMLLCE